eukprot:gnl/MRDRNA2_/MRDRNA2_86327_c0_seq2.p1 gnl/MRDRNA2_/MRDRNA2_86327_c0~~gnl/MRDRNA2_/MRDRNA2_86327_c0_seq2.p1  ORF type:complete len:245 (+),score=7.16 gnl/MRDRNA2_/MRDRNA2_86327_c0_seq2:612-1346(+)
MKANPLTKTSCAFLEYKEIKMSEKALVILNGLQIAGSFWIIERHTVPEINNSSPSYATPVEALQLMKAHSKIVSVSGPLNNILAEEEDKLQLIGGIFEKECSRFGRIQSLHIPRYSDSGINKGKRKKAKIHVMKKIKRSVIVGENILTSNNVRTVTAKNILLGEILVQFTRNIIAQVAIHSINRQKFLGRRMFCRFFSIAKYRSIYGKGLVPLTKNDTVQLALDTREKLLASDVKLFQHNNFQI